MAKSKSLGSSPIEFKSKKSSMGFIPDLGVSGDKKKPSEEPSKTLLKTAENKKENKTESHSQPSSKAKKKVVSYYMDTDLIDRVKSVADQKDMYYSSLVTTALKSWFSSNT